MSIFGVFSSLDDTLPSLFIFYAGVQLIIVIAKVFYNVDSTKKTRTNFWSYKYFIILTFVLFPTGICLVIIIVLLPSKAPSPINDTREWYAPCCV